MRRLISACILVLACAVPAQAQLSVVQSQQFSGTYPVTSGQVTLTGTTAGNLIVVAVSQYSEGANFARTVSDGTNGSYTALTGQATGNFQVQLYYFQNSAGGSLTITVDPTVANSDLWFSASEIAGAATASVLDVQNAAAGTSAAPSVSVTTTVADTIVIGLFNHSAGGSNHATDVGSGWTLIHEQHGGLTVMPGLSEYQIFSSAGAKTVDGSIDASASWNMVAAAFKAGASAVAAPKLPLLGVGEL